MRKNKKNVYEEKKEKIYTIESKESCGVLLKLLRNWTLETSRNQDEYSSINIEDIIIKIKKLQKDIKYNIYFFYDTPFGPNSSELVRDLKILVNQKNLKLHDSIFSINPSGILNASRIIFPRIIEERIKK